jgi:hypothetical protein
MRSKSLVLLRVVTMISLAVLLGSSVFARISVCDQQQPETSKPQETKKPEISDAEAKAANAINAAPDAAAKLAAANEFLKKYPKSPVRLDVAKYVAGQIGGVNDATQKLTLAESFQKTFTAENEQELIVPTLLDAYFAAQRTDDAFKLGASVLSKQPEHVGVLTQLAIAGTEEAKKRNPKYITQSAQHGLKAIELIEANKKPAQLDEQAWGEIKAMLPILYQSMGVLSMASSNQAEAKPRFEKASTLNPTDPFNYVMLGSITDDEYQKAAEKYKAMPEGKEKAEALKSAQALMDKAIDYYARAVATSEGRPEYKQLHDQILQDMTPYYKYRHGGSAEGMQQLIDKYKVPAKP